MAIILVTKRSAGVTPEVNLGEYVTCMPLSSANKAADYGFNTQRRHYQTSEIGVSVAPKMEMCPPNTGIMIGKVEHSSSHLLNGGIVNYKGTTE